MLRGVLLNHLGEHLVLGLFRESIPELIRSRGIGYTDFGHEVEALTSVSTAPGHTTFTRMGARSMANARVRASTAPIVLIIIDQVRSGFTKLLPMITHS